MTKSAKIRIGKSKFHHHGIIASTNIKSGEKIFLIKGKKVSFLINSKKQADKAGFNWIGYDKNTWIDPVDYGRFINHSCSPNAGIVKRIEVIAMRDIEAGEEITFDYSLSEADIYWHIQCNCKSPDCRKKIRSIQFLPRRTFDKNLRYIPVYFRKVFKKFNYANFENTYELRKKWLNFIEKGFKV